MTLSRIAVLGAGANGAAMGASLARSGHDVVLIDQWARNVQAMQADGVVVCTERETTTTPVRACHLSEVAGFRRSFDLVVLGVKGYDTRWSAQLIEPLLAPDGVMVGMQNGMTSGAIASIVGASRTLGCVIEVAASMFEPGIVQQQAPMWFALGAAPSGPHSRVAEAASIFSAAGTATVSDDILSSKWMKLVANASELVTSALLDLPLAEAIAVPGMFDFMLSAGEEAARAAIASGHQIVPIFGIDQVSALTPEQYARRLLDTVLTNYTRADTLTTVLQDWRKGRRAEIEEIHGYVVRVSGSAQASVPANVRVRDLARQVEAGKLAPGLENATLMTGLDVPG